jgi:hypothetical protein
MDAEGRETSQASELTKPLPHCQPRRNRLGAHGPVLMIAGGRPTQRDDRRQRGRSKEQGRKHEKNPVAEAENQAP